MFICNRAVEQILLRRVSTRCSKYCRFERKMTFLHCLWLMNQKKMCLSQELTLETLSFQQQHKNDKVPGIRKYLNSTYILRILVGPWYEIFHTSFICIISDLNLSTKGLKAFLPVTSAQLFLISHNEIWSILRSEKWHSTFFFLQLYYWMQNNENILNCLCSSKWYLLIMLRKG